MSDYIYDPNALYHHGVMGMKWGLRRYQTKSGTLTDKGRARFEKVASNKLLQAKNKTRAITGLNREIGYDNRQAKRNRKKADKALKKADKMDVKYNEHNGVKYVDIKDPTRGITRNIKPDPKKAAKYASKRDRQLEKAQEYADKARKFTNKSKSNSAYLKDIKDGTVKAGKDYITQSDYNLYIIPAPKGALLYTSRTDKVIKNDGSVK